MRRINLNSFRTVSGQNTASQNTMGHKTTESNYQRTKHQRIRKLGTVPREV